MTKTDPEMPTEPAPTGPDNSGRAAIIAASAAGLMLLASFAFIALQLRAPSDRFAACREVQIAGGQKLGGPFELIDQNGQSVTERDVIDRPALIYFGYTFCPDVCPLDVVRNVEAVDILAEGGKEVRPVFITIDPARDTPSALNDYAYAMHDEMVALTGPEDKIKRTLAAFGGQAAKMDDDPEYYLMSHSTLSYLMLPDEGVVALFTRRLDSEELAQKTACYLDAA